MSWPDKYWDAVDQFYWEPSHLGLASIPKSEWGADPDLIQLSRSKVQKGGTLYTRRGTSKVNALRMRSLEETLNHIFDITFAIAPDAVLSACFLRPLGIFDSGPFTRFGREVKQRYSWSDVNVTQQDGFFVSPRSAVGVELKLGATTSKVQVLKYLALMVMEQRLSGRREALGLLYVTPNEDLGAIAKTCGADPHGTLASGWLDGLQRSQLNSTLRSLVEEYSTDFEAAAARVRLAYITWRDLVAECRSIASELDSEKAGDETLHRLLAGFVSAVEEHSGTKVR